jgi:hypothetical protein
VKDEVITNVRKIDGTTVRYLITDEILIEEEIMNAPKNNGCHGGQAFKGLDWTARERLAGADFGP